MSRVASRKKLLWLAAIFSALAVGCACYVYFVDIPLRTQIYRSLFKGNWNLYADGDTVYATGYCGIRKYLVRDAKAVLLAENESFLEHRMIGHGVAIKGNNIFFFFFSYLPGPDKNDKADYEGKLIVLDKTSLNIQSEFALPSKMNDANVCDSILLLSGINRFFLFNVSDPQFPQLLFEHISPEYKEYQGTAVWKDGGKMYAAFTLFTLGVDIWDITDCARPRFLKNIKLSDVCGGNSNIQTLAIKACPPYLFATLAPTPNVYFQKEDVRGVIRVDVSNVDSVKAKAFYIPRKDYWESMPGDAHPKSVDVYNGKIYLSAATSGSAVFKIEENGNLRYDGLFGISSGRDQIYPICVTKNAYLVSGDWNWNKIHVKKIQRAGNLAPR